MIQQQVYATRTVRRMDDVAREQEAAEHEELLSRARRASKRAARVSAMATTLLAEIEAHSA